MDVGGQKSWCIDMGRDMVSLGVCWNEMEEVSQDGTAEYSSLVMKVNPAWIVAGRGLV
jgi:hypothetical protein